MKTMLIAFDFDLDSRGIICYKIIANVISCLNLAYKYKGEKWAGRAEKIINKDFCQTFNYIFCPC